MDQSAPLPPPPPGFTKNPSSLPSVFSIMRSGFEIYKDESRTLSTLGGIYFVASFIFAGLLAATFLAGAFVFPYVGMLAVTSMAIAALVLIVGFYWFIVLTMLAILYTIRSHSKHISLKESYALAYPYVWEFIWVNILSILVVLGVFVIFGIVSLVILLPGIIWLPDALPFLSMIAFLIAGIAALIFASTWFGFTDWLFIDENARGLHAIALSKHLSHAQFAQIAWRIFVLGVAYGIAVMIVQIVAVGFFSFLSTTSDVVLSRIITDGFTLLLAVPILLSAFFALYKDLSVVEEVDPMSVEHGEHRGMLIGLAVVGLIGLIAFPIVSGFTMSYLQNQSSMQDNAVRISDIDSLHTDLQLYYVTHGNLYPNSLMQLITPGVSRMSGITMQDISDPQTHRLYFYETSKDKQSYLVCADFSSGRQYCSQVNAPMNHIHSSMTASSTEMMASTTPKRAKK